MINQFQCPSPKDTYDATKVTIARLVLENANLSYEVQALRRVLSEYELSTSQDLLSLAHWLAQELKVIPTEALNKSLTYLTEGNMLKVSLM